MNFTKLPDVAVKLVVDYVWNPDPKAKTLLEESIDRCTNFFADQLRFYPRYFNTMPDLTKSIKSIQLHINNDIKKMNKLWEDYSSRVFYDPQLKDQVNRANSRSLADYVPKTLLQESIRRCMNFFANQARFYQNYLDQIPGSTESLQSIQLDINNEIEEVNKLWKHYSSRIFDDPQLKAQVDSANSQYAAPSFKVTYIQNPQANLI